MKKLFIKTYGCQMNAYDSARMADLLAPLGYEQSDVSETADMVVLNTCHIREKAVEKVYSELGRIAVQKRANPGMLVAVAGCVAQAEGQEMLRRMPSVDLLVGPQSYHRLPEMIARHARDHGHQLQTDFPALEKFDSLPEVSATGVSAFLTVQEGCDKFCTFCVVPYTRGPEHSRPPEQIIAEAKALASRGAREIILLGQNVNAYRGHDTHGKQWNLARLIAGIAAIPQIFRIRYTTSHPRDMDDDLIAAHGDIEKLMPFLHLPVQSGSDAVLEAMNRQHTADDYLRLIARLRAARPDIAFSSDFIVGFPGESDADFEATMALVREVKFAQCFSFKYSPRPGTPAAAARKLVPEALKTTRLLALQALLLEQQDQANLAAIGKTLPVLFEKPGREPGQIMGRTPYLQPVHVQGRESLIGKIQDVRINALTANSLHGALAERSGVKKSKKPGNEKKTVSEQITLELDDNKLLAALGGPHEKNFARLEQKLDLRVTQRGNHIAITGSDRRRGATILSALYARLEAGESITLAEVDSELRFTDEGARAETAGAVRTAATRLTRPRSPVQAAYLDLMRHHPLVFGIGPAGTGKTYLAAAFGTHMLYQRRVERLILSRPALEAGERLGFLPGDLKEKIDPYLRPLYDALFDVLGDQAGRLIEQGVIEVAPLAFMRGRTLSRAFVILDEAQNTTPAQMKMVLTRLGEDSQMVVTADPGQSDLPGGVAAGLNEALSILDGVEGVAIQRFSDADVVRHALVSRIVRAYTAKGK